HEAGPHRVADTDHHDGNRRRRLLGRNTGRRPIGGDHVHRTADELGRRAGKSLRHPIGVTVVEYDVVTFEVAEVAQPLAESIPHQRIIGGGEAGKRGGVWGGGCGRATEGRATKHGKKVPPPHSMTSSARASSEDGTVRPSVLAVLRLISSSNLVGCSTGRSPGFVPL